MLAPAVGALALLAVAGPALAEPRDDAPGAGAAAVDQAREPSLWATVNVCDTVGHPDGMGIRGSMPGTGDRRDGMYIRLQLQFLRRSDDTWRNVGRAGDSGFIFLGSGAARVRQAGRTFTLSPPQNGRRAFLLRGLVTFEWRRNGQVHRRARRLTTAGHPDTPGADPSDFSAATCSIR